MKIVLASASPRRQELIKLLTDNAVISPSEAEEIIPKKMKIEKIPEHLSLLKAYEVSLKYPEDIVIGCDTVVISGREILGKPKDDRDAEKMLKKLSGKWHKVVSGVSIIKGEKVLTFSEKTLVKFKKLSDCDIKTYLKTGEHRDKAGSYAIQGKGTFFVDGIKGDYFNVVGFPVSKIAEKLKEIT